MFRKDYDGGPDRAIAAFGEEVRAGNPACDDALRSLREHLGAENSSGPVRAGHFIFGDQAMDTPDQAYRRMDVRQTMVDVAAGLLKAAGG